MSPNLGERQAALIVERDAIRQQRVKAVLNGETFDSSRLSQVESELAAIEDAEQHLSDERQASEISAEAARQEAVRAAISAREIKRYAALRAAQRCAEKLREAIAKAQALAGEQARDFAALGMSPPLTHQIAQTERRLSEMLVWTLLAPISTRATALGCLAWRSPPADRHGNWAEIERAVCLHVVNATLNPLAPAAPMIDEPSPGPADASVALAEPPPTPTDEQRRNAA